MRVVSISFYFSNIDLKLLSLIELKRRAGNGKDVSRQLIINERLREATFGIKRKLSEVD